MSRKTRVIAIILAAVFVAFVALSISFMMIEAGHNCTGEDCPVCALCAALTHIIRSAAACILAAMIASLSVSELRRVALRLRIEYRTATPVTLKTKLSN